MGVGCKQISSSLMSGAQLWGDCFQLLSGLKSGAHLWGDCKQILSGLKSDCPTFHWESVHRPSFLNIDFQSRMENGGGGGTANYSLQSD
jgi:hypothetical protein